MQYPGDLVSLPSLPSMEYRAWFKKKTAALIGDIFKKLTGMIRMSQKLAIDIRRDIPIVLSENAGLCPVSASHMHHHLFVP